MSLEDRAIDLDEARKARILKSQVIDVEKYLHANDVTIQVKQATSFLDSLKQNYLSDSKANQILMPWTKIMDNLRFVMEKSRFTLVETVAVNR
jgi:hypothetical protein